MKLMNMMYNEYVVNSNYTIAIAGFAMFCYLSISH